MADETKLPVLGSNPSPSSTSPSSGVSPLSPPIKTPPPAIGQFSVEGPRPMGGSPLPPNLPTGEFRSPVSGILSALPSTPSAPKPPQAPLPPSAPTPKPSAPLPPPAYTKPVSEQPGVFKSSIRTMQEDIAALKKGQAPAGFEIQKQSEKETKSPTETAGPRIIPPPRPTSQVELGRLERSKLLPGGAPGISPLPQPPKPANPPSLGPLGSAIKIPSIGGGGNFASLLKLKPRNIGLAAAAIVVVGFLIWFFAIRAPSVPQETASFTPTATPTQTAAPSVKSPIEKAFGIVSLVNLDLSGGPQLFSRLLEVVDKNVLAGREPALYKISNSQTGQKYGFNDFMSSALVNPPQSATSLVDNANSYLSLLLRADGGYSYAFVAKLKNTNTEPTISDIKSWETNFSNDLKDLFGLDLTKAASVGFLDNAYQGTAIRYRNFPDTIKTIDYLVARMANGDRYLVITNSREHIYVIIDKLLSPIPAQ